MSKQVPCETDGRRPETVGNLELKSPRSAFSSNVGKKSFVLLSLDIPNLVMVKTNGTLACLGEFVYSTTPL